MSYCVLCFEAIAGILQSVQDFDVQILRKFNENSPYTQPQSSELSFKVDYFI